MRTQTSLVVMAGIAAFVFLLLSPPAQASVIGIYSDRADWEAVTAGRTDIDFSALGLAQGGYAQYRTSAGVTVGGVNFVGVAPHASPAWELKAFNPPPGDPQYFNSGTILAWPLEFSSSYLLATLPEAATSFGIDLASAWPSGGSFRIELDGFDTGELILTSAPPVLTFFGVTTDTPFTQVKVRLVTGTQGVTSPIYDNVSFGQLYIAGAGGEGGEQEIPTETPEATTLLYVASGIALVVFSRRRKRELAG